jgi:hypothetical protein
MMGAATSFVVGPSKDDQAIRQGFVTGAAQHTGVSEHHQLLGAMMKERSQERSKMAQTGVSG